MSATWHRDAEQEIAELRARLAEAEGILEAIRLGEIDAVVVKGSDGERVFTLEGADHRYRMLVESMSEGAATVTPDGVILYANRGLASLLDTATANLVGSKISGWVRGDDITSVEALLQDSSESPQAVELTLWPPSGQKVPVKASCTTLLLDGARVHCVIVTDLRLARHQAALELAAARARDINQRLRESEARLLESEAALREADRRKDEFLATLSHELRNPLAPIRNAAMLLGSSKLTEDSLAWARQVIQRQVKHMALLLDDLLDVARITQGKLDLHTERVSLTSVIDSAVEAARPLLDSKNHQLAVSLPAQIPRLDADPLRLSQVVANLLTNAAKYTDPGGRIELAAQAEGGSLVFTVVDNGIGIPRQALGEIFTMFSQVAGTGGRSEGGLGIGLALVKGIVALHGGSIEAQSDGPGCGSKFTVRLPLATAEPAARVTVSGEGEQQPCRGRRVLVVDDNKDAAETLGMLLGLAGHEVRVAHDGRAALSLAQTFRPDVALLDIGMPDLDGYHVAQALRAEPWGSDIRLIALTGWGQTEDRERALGSGFDHHLTKPVEPHVLDALLRNPSPS